MERGLLARGAHSQEKPRRLLAHPKRINLDGSTSHEEVDEKARALAKEEVFPRCLTGAREISRRLMPLVGHPDRGEFLGAQIAWLGLPHRVGCQAFAGEVVDDGQNAEVMSASPIHLREMVGPARYR
jgi:hypothetical protein